MKHRIAAVIAAALLLCLSIGVAPVAAAGQGECNHDDLNVNFFEGAEQNATNGFSFVDAAKADIDSTGFWACDFPNTTDTFGIGGWVALSPKTFFSVYSLVQIGMIACGDGAQGAQGIYDVCHFHNNQLRFFWADGGCFDSGGHFIPPFAQDLHGAGYINFDPTYGVTYNFSVTHEPSPAAFHLFVNGVERLSIPDSSPAIKCWAQTNPYNQYKATYYFEFENRGDSWGTIPNNAHLGGAQYSNFGEGTWRNTAWNSASACNGASDNPASPPSVSQHCDVLSVNSFRAYNTVP